MSDNEKELFIPTSPPDETKKSMGHKKLQRISSIEKMISAPKFFNREENMKAEKYFFTLCHIFGFVVLQFVVQVVLQSDFEHFKNQINLMLKQKRIEPIKIVLGQVHDYFNRTFSLKEFMAVVVVCCKSERNFPEESCDRRELFTTIREYPNWKNFPSFGKIAKKLCRILNWDHIFVYDVVYSKQSQLNLKSNNTSILLRKYAHINNSKIPHIQPLKQFIAVNFNR